VRVTTLSDLAIQLPLFEVDPLRQRRLNLALDRLVERHGRGIVQPGWLQPREPREVMHPFLQPLDAG